MTELIGLTNNSILSVKLFFLFGKQKTTVYAANINNKHYMQTF